MGRVPGGAAATTPAVFAPAAFGRLLRPLTVFHPEWVGGRIDDADRRARRASARSPARWSTASCGAVFVQGALVLYYFAVAYALHLDIALWDLAVVCRSRSWCRCCRCRSAASACARRSSRYYFHRIGQPIEDAVLLSLVAQALLMLFSLSGLAVYIWRQRHPPLTLAIKISEVGSSPRTRDPI